MEGPFDSACFKWVQAVINADVLQANINDLAHQPQLQVGFGYMQEYDAKRHRIDLYAEVVPRVFPLHWGPLLGDIIHNFRSCLDHVAWALYKRGRTPNLTEKQESRIYFPIYDDRIAYNKALPRKLPGVRRADLARVRKVQPYRARKRSHKHVLTVLDNLSRDDKHRVIQPIQAIPERADYTLTLQRDCIARGMTPRTRRVALEQGTYLGSVLVRRTGPDPYVDVQPRFTLDPAIYEWLSFQEWAGRTILLTAGILQQFADPPEDVRVLLGRTSHGATPPWLSPSTGELPVKREYPLQVERQGFAHTPQRRAS